MPLVVLAWNLPDVDSSTPRWPVLFFLFLLRFRGLAPASGIARGGRAVQSALAPLHTPLTSHRRRAARSEDLRLAQMFAALAATR